MPRQPRWYMIILGTVRQKIAGNVSVGRQEPSRSGDLIRATYMSGAWQTSSGKAGIQEGGRNRAKSKMKPHDHVAILRFDPRAKVSSKKCLVCKKTKVIGEYYGDQTQCKLCFNTERKMVRRAKAQGLDTWLQELKRDQNKMYAGVFKQFGKHVAASEAPSKFCMASWKKKITARAGQRSSRKSKMMWENEFVEWKGLTAQGNVHPDIARQEWRDLIKTGVASDRSGPSGSLRLRIVLGDYGSDYEDLFEDDEVEGLITQKKGATADQLATMANRAMDSAGGSILAADREEAERKRQELGSRMTTASLVRIVWGALGALPLLATFLGSCQRSR